MIVRLERNYSYPDLFRQTPDGKGKWNNVQFTFDDLKKCDYVVVFNRPLRNIKTTCLKGGKIIIIQEPPYERNSFFKYHFRFYDKIISAFESDDNFKIINSPAGLPWHVDKNYNELTALDIGINQKQDRVSWITSNNNKCLQHQKRLDFVDFLRKNEYEYDLFGRGFTPINDKFNGVYPYKYTIAAENYIADDYFTEKIFDAYLSWSMPIYAGCTNITKYFPKESMIQIDFDQPQQALEMIKEAVANKIWDKNIEAIRHARELVLNEYQMFPMLERMLTEASASNNEKLYKKCFIPASGLTKKEELKKSIKSLFIKNN